MRITPLDRRRQVGVHAEEREVRADELEDEARHDRPDDPATSAGEAHPAEDDRGHALAACTAPGTGDPMPVAAVIARPPNAQNSPPIA